MPPAALAPPAEAEVRRAPDVAQVHLVNSACRYLPQGRTSTPWPHVADEIREARGLSWEVGRRSGHSRPKRRCCPSVSTPSGRDDPLVASRTPPVARPARSDPSRVGEQLAQISSPLNRGRRYRALLFRALRGRRLVGAAMPCPMSCGPRRARGRSGPAPGRTTALQLGCHTSPAGPSGKWTRRARRRTGLQGHFPVGVPGGWAPALVDAAQDVGGLSSGGGGPCHGEGCGGHGSNHYRRPPVQGPQRQAAPPPDNVRGARPEDLPRSFPARTPGSRPRLAPFLPHALQMRRARPVVTSKGWPGRRSGPGCGRTRRVPRAAHLAADGGTATLSRRRCRHPTAWRARIWLSSGRRNAPVSAALLETRSWSRMRLAWRVIMANDPATSSTPTSSTGSHFAKIYYYLYWLTPDPRFRTRFRPRRGWRGRNSQPRISCGPVAERTVRRFTTTAGWGEAVGDGSGDRRSEAGQAAGPLRLDFCDPCPHASAPPSAAPPVVGERRTVRSATGHSCLG